MEDIVQRVFSIIFAVIVLFIMPIYMTFEKRDDISYALALKITSNFVDKIKSKGYITSDMYSDFVSELGLTDNTYEIKFEHKVKKYNPVINVYLKSDGSLVDILDYSLYEETFNSKDPKKVYITRNYNGTEVQYSEELYNFVLTYKLGELIYTDEQILDYLSQENKENKINYFKLSDEENYKAYKDIDKKKIPDLPLVCQTEEGNAIYKMAVGDEFTVTLRNTNITIASVLFDALTFNGITSGFPRVYINYGGQIKNQEYTELMEK